MLSNVEVSSTLYLNNSPDDDGDGIINLLDNCVFVPNPDQADANHNGIGDACEVRPTLRCITHNGDDEDDDDDRHDRDGHDRDGHDRDGHDRDGHDRDGHDRDGHDRDGHDRDGHDKDKHVIIAHFGYVNQGFALTVPIGNDNALVGNVSVVAGAQPTVFESGVHPDEFAVSFDHKDKVTWTVNGVSVTADRHSRNCKSLH